MSAQHTPGPWSIGGKYASKSVLLNARGESIASGGNNRAVQGEELEASLRLAAAAPELLEALEVVTNKLAALVDSMDDPEAAKSYGYTKALKQSRAAIAKATGSAA